MHTQRRHNKRIEMTYLPYGYNAYVCVWIHAVKHRDEHIVTVDVQIALYLYTFIPYAGPVAVCHGYIIQIFRDVCC